MGVTDILKVRLWKRSYPIYIGHNIFKDIPALFARFKKGEKVMIITNPALEKMFGKKIKGLLESRIDQEVYLFSLPLEEEDKNIQTVDRIYKELSRLKFERNSSLIALGGGVIGDIVGFVAATYLRGLNYFQIPTTLLAQVDSSVGGKTAVNLPSGKNLIGTFYQPKAVFIDSETLESLPRREWLGGLAEVIKYGVIRDQNFFKFLEKQFPTLPAPKKIEIKDADLHKIIKRCCKIKAYIVSCDEKECGLRAILNYGHTIGHALEVYTKHQVSHGEAVALGMVAAAHLAESMHLIKRSTVIRLRALLEKVGLPVTLKDINHNKLIEIMSRDKKVEDKKIRFVLPVRIGKVKIFNNVTAENIKLALEALKTKNI